MEMGINHFIMYASLETLNVTQLRQLVQCREAELALIRANLTRLCTQKWMPNLQMIVRGLYPELDDILELAVKGEAGVCHDCRYAEETEHPACAELGCLCFCNEGEASR